MSQQLVPLDPRVKALWLLAGLGGVAQVTLPVAVLDLFGVLPSPRGLTTGLVAVAGGAVAAVTPVLRYRRWRYALRERDLWIRRGVLWVNVSVIPYARIQFVDTRQGPLDRLFGLAQVVVHTAALGTSGRLPGLEAAAAERLREHLADVQQHDAAV